jgi:hypothetical protein
VGLSLHGVTVYSMRKIIALLVTIGVSVGGFLWWKHRQVIAANEVSADPWPAAVVPVLIPAVDYPAATADPVADPVDTKSQPKKSTPKKKATKKATQKSD